MFLKTLCASAAVLCIATSAAACTVDDTRYDRLAFDMTYANVAAIFQCDGEEGLKAQVESGAATVYDWEDKTTGATVSTVFVGNALRSMMAPN